jgi:D-arabinan endo alpha-(1,5)-arabinofuranosidase
MKKILVFSFIIINAFLYGQNPGIFKLENRSDLVPFDLERISRVTGKSLPEESLPNPNHTDELYDVGGTDLGIMWEMEPGRVGIFFGDTFGKNFKMIKRGGGNGGNWRSNVLAFSDDNDLDDGISFSGMALNKSGDAREIIFSAHDRSGTGDFTSIPSAAIRANGIDFAYYMNIKKWGEPGEWSSNYSSLYRSSDNGNSWEKCPEVTFSSESNFSQVALGKKDGYIYMLGTIPGRFGDAYLSRFAEVDILDQSKYEYWNKKDGWIAGKENLATPVFDGPVGELSIIYNTMFKRWIVTYLDMSEEGIVLRDAAQITGPWSNKKTLVSGSEYPWHYGAYIYPLKNENDELYFLMSLWYPYNVFLMKTKLKYEE